MSLLPHVLQYLRAQRCNAICSGITTMVVLKRLIVGGHTFTYLVFSCREKCSKCGVVLVAVCIVLVANYSIVCCINFCVSF